MSPIYFGEAVQDQLKILRRSALTPDEKRVQAVSDILKQVWQEGDTALLRLAQQFGDPVIDGFQLTDQQKAKAIGRVSFETRKLLERAADNIRTFGEAVMQSLQSVHLQKEGFSVGLDWRPVERLACYVPGGRHPLPSTALMTTITAQAAGVSGNCHAIPPSLR